ncbi:MAG: multiheme c-type cytochrome, partial [Pseudomonadota bacterium]
PDTCGKCHVGPDHPQIEVYNESKHGILYRAKMDEMNLDSDKWQAGVDYSASATCATCHMSAGGTEGKTHNVGDRISWNLRSPISKKINLVKLDNGQEKDFPGADAELPKVGDSPDWANGAKVAEVLTWEQRRDKMKTVCRACHTSGVVEGHYKQFDDLVALYNEKFAKPTAAIVKELKANGKLTKSPFDEKLEWIWWEIWHHEGRRARHGASMSGPDYAWWHGIYDVAKHFYFKFIPELEHVVGKDEAKKILEKHLTHEGHQWYFTGMDKDQIDMIRKGYEERYGKGSLEGAAEK